MPTDPNEEQPPVNYGELLQTNQNFRFLWLGQIVSLLGDWFNLIASASLIVFPAIQIVQVAISEQVFIIGQGGGIGLGIMFGTYGIGTGLGPIAARWVTGDNAQRLRQAIVFLRTLS